MADPENLFRGSPIVSNRRPPTFSNGIRKLGRFIIYITKVSMGRSDPGASFRSATENQSELLSIDSYF